MYAAVLLIGETNNSFMRDSITSSSSDKYSLSPSKNCTHVEDLLCVMEHLSDLSLNA